MTPVQIGPLNDVVLSVHPVHTAPGIINGEAVGPEEMSISDDAAAGAIHAGGLDAGGVAPVCPVNGPGKREKGIERQVVEGNGKVPSIAIRQRALSDSTQGLQLVGNTFCWVYNFSMFDLLILLLLNIVLATSHGMWALSSLTRD